MTRRRVSLYRTYSRALLTKRAGASYETDVELYAPDGSIRLQVEAKASPRQVATIVRQLDAAPELAALPTSVVKEIEYVLDLKPEFLWIVGPGSVDPEQHVYRVDVNELNAGFTRVSALPGPGPDGEG